MIKKCFRLMLLVAFALSSVMFVACNKYDDDIERIDGEIAALNATVQSLKAAVDGGAVISSVSNTADGVKFTLSNGQSYTINHGTDGAAGNDGAAGKDGSIVEIGENGNWFIDGVDTGKSAKGQDGKAPQINAAGNWEVWDAATQSWVDTKQSAVGAQTYVVEHTAYFELHVMQKDAAGNNMGYNVVLLPKTLPISDIKVVTLDDNKITKTGAEITLNYGSALAKAKSFNGKDYAKGANLVASGASLSAMINPTSVNASGLGFTLVDSKGNAPYVISSVTANMTEGALTRADETPNAGVWDMAVELHPDLTYQDLAGNTFADARSKAYYALAVQTANGTVASAYDVKVTENCVGTITVGTLANLTGKVNEGLDLRKAFETTAGSTYADLTPYIVDCYFAIVDATKAATYGVTLNGNVLTATKPVPASENFLIKASYLLVDGTEMDMEDYPYTNYKTFKVTFDQVASTMSLGDVTWTIKTKTGSSNSYNKVYLPITEELRTILTGTADAQIPTVKTVKVDGTTKTAWTWADDSELDTKAVAVNGVQYGYGANAVKFANSDLDQWIATVREGKVMRYNSSTYAYEDATSIQNANYVRFTFNTAQAFPGEYKLTLEFTSAHPTAPVTVKVPVKVIITAPTSFRLIRNEAYFSGDDAVVYGDPSEDKVKFNLFNLYKSMDNGYNDEATNVRFTTSHEAHNCSVEWLTGTYNYDTDGTTKLYKDGDIQVSKSRYNYGSDNRDGVYTTRQVQVRYKVFNNPHIPYVIDEFNLTVKSELAEGTFDASAAAINIANTQTHLISFKNVVAKDVYGNVYNLAPTYKYCEEHNAYDDLLVSAKDSRINGDVKLILSDDNADQYLEVVDGIVNAQDGYSALQIRRKADSNGGYAALTSDVTCTVKVRFTDMWGRRIESPVTVTIKKN